MELSLICSIKQMVTAKCLCCRYEGVRCSFVVWYNITYQHRLDLDDVNLWQEGYICKIFNSCFESNSWKKAINIILYNTMCTCISVKISFLHWFHVKTNIYNGALHKHWFSWVQKLATVNPYWKVFQGHLFYIFIKWVFTCQCLPLLDPQYR